MKVIVGPMYAGKTTEMMKLYNECKTSKLYCKFTLEISEKPIKKNISNHGKEEVEGYTVNTFEQMIPLAKDAETIFMDELQFAQDWEKFSLLVRDKKVYISGLDMDFRGQPFKNMADLLCYATEIHKCHGVCPKNHPTEFTWKDPDVNFEGNLHESDSPFQPICRQCFYKGLTPCNVLNK